MIYLSGHASTKLIDAAKGLPIGLLIQPGNGYASMVTRWQWWAADNACFTTGERFQYPIYHAWLDGLPRKGCLFATAPDVVGDARATWARSCDVLGCIRGLGFPAALVAQDGIETLAIEWEAFDVLFIGGTTGWKESSCVPELVREAKQRDKWVHMGRVNSFRRIRLAKEIGCDSVDGTYLAFGPDKNWPKLVRWMERVELQTYFELWPVSPSWRGEW